MCARVPCRHSLGARWTLAVSIVVPWDYGDQQRQTDPETGRFKRLQERSDDERTRLCKHFARIGFEQFSETYWFLERSQMPPGPLPKEQVASLEPFHPAPEQEPPRLSELDQALVKAVEKASTAPASDMEVSLEAIRQLLNAGASISGACALHFAVGASAYKTGPGRWRPDAAELLLQEYPQSCDINHADVNLNTALHVAAENGSRSAVSLLLEHGADPLLRNIAGDTPLEVNSRAATAKIQSMMDFSAARQWDRRPEFSGREPAGVETARGCLPCSQLLQRATRARDKQHEARATLVQCLMYDRSMPVDVLRKIHALVAPPPISEYPAACDLGLDTHVLITMAPAAASGRTLRSSALLVDARLNGCRGTVVGSNSLHSYSCEQRIATFVHDIQPWTSTAGSATYQVPWEQLLPLSWQLQGSGN